MPTTVLLTQFIFIYLFQIYEIISNYINKVLIWCVREKKEKNTTLIYLAPIELISESELISEVSIAILFFQFDFKSVKLKNEFKNEKKTGKIIVNNNNNFAHFPAKKKKSQIYVSF